MTGESVKLLLYQKGIKITDLAEKLGESQQNTSSFLRAQDIKTGVLERIAEATGIPITEFFGIQPSNIATGDGNTQVAGNNNQVNSENFTSLLAKKDEQIDRLLKIIEQLSK